MATWDDLATAEPELAADGRRLLRRTGIGEGLLATIRDDLPPRTVVAVTRLGFGNPDRLLRPAGVVVTASQG